MPKTKSFYGHGKLLITGEYAVLDGATALAVPTRQGQRLTVAPSDDKKLRWLSYGPDGKPWFKARLRYRKERWKVLKTNDAKVADRLVAILQAADEVGAEVGEELTGKTVRTELEFPLHWGLGTSSTLIHCLAQWWRIDAYDLLAETFGGSGYDIACAAADGPIRYRNTTLGPEAEFIDWRPTYRDQLYFVYLEAKQNSRDGIKRYHKRRPDPAWVDEISGLTEAFLGVDDLAEAQYLLRRHERTIAQQIELPTVQSERFSDFPGVVKSLGAWGGDFAMALPNATYRRSVEYFKEKGYPTVLSFAELFGK